LLLRIQISFDKLQKGTVETLSKVQRSSTITSSIDLPRGKLANMGLKELLKASKREMVKATLDYCTSVEQ